MKSNAPTITTGLPHGRVTAFKLDNVVVSFDIGNLRFDDQIEIEGAGDGPFSDGGDSGSLIVGRDKRGVALLFAGGDQGGANDQGIRSGSEPVHRAEAAQFLGALTLGRNSSGQPGGGQEENIECSHLLHGAGRRGGCSGSFHVQRRLIR